MAKSYLRFWGVRGSYAAPFPSHTRVGGNTSCVEISSDGHSLVCDAGTGIIPLGDEMILRTDNNKKLLILLTHYHWDHICGLPFFKPAFIPGWEINLFAPGQSAGEIEQNLSAQMQVPFFPVSTETWLATINYLDPKKTNIDYGPINITCHHVHHPGITYGYKIKVGNKIIMYISDNECRFLDKSVKQKMDTFNEEEQQMFEAVNREEYAYELQSIKGADILIHDAQYTPEDYETKRGWGHSCYVDVINYAIDAGVKEVYLYHHDPGYNDEAIDNIHENCQKIIKQREAFLKCHIARENGLEIGLD